MESPHDLRHALIEHGVAVGDGDTEAAPHIGLDAHDLVEACECPAFGMVGEKKIHGTPLLAQSVGQQDLSHFHVDAHDHALDLGIGRSCKDSRIDERVRETFQIELPALVGG